MEIVMEDSAGNGWNGNVFALTQGDKLKTTFGFDFNSGRYQTKETSNIGQNKIVSVVVQQKGTKLS